MKIMRNLFFSLLILFSFIAVTSAQNVEAIKYDETKAVPCDQLLGRLDYYFTQILNNSDIAKGYIVVYEGKILSYKKENKLVYPPRGYAKSWLQTVKDHMKFRTVSDEKIMFIEGGFRNDFTAEFWIVPNKATPPKTTPTLEKIKYRKGKATDICEGL